MLRSPATLHAAEQKVNLIIANAEIDPPPTATRSSESVRLVRQHNNPYNNQAASLI
jgi:hypothetical protein